MGGFSHQNWGKKKTGVMKWDPFFFLGGGGEEYEGTFGSMCRAPFVLKKSFIFLISLIL